MNNVLLVDVNYICSRAYFATGFLEFEGKGTGMALGAIQTVETCRELFGSTVIVLAFDRGKGLRRAIYPQYKANRREGLSEEEKAIKQEYIRQLRKMPRLFKRMGYRNIFSQKGYEADDVIAGVVQGMEENDRAVIVSADQDLWQLLRSNAICYDPRVKKRTTRQLFVEEWGVLPEMWPHVKAFAGDTSDNIEGIRGIGLKTAAKYYAGTLKPGAAMDKIEAGLSIHNRNLQLIRLPLDGLETFDLRMDRLTAERRAFVMRKLGASERRWKR